MKPRWLLLAVSVICFMVLFPAAALSQSATVNAGCGTATIDGYARPAEWENAGKVALFPELGGDTQVHSPIQLLEVEASQTDEVTGELWVMNDTSQVYLAVSLALDEARLHPDFWSALTYIMFTDEGDALDGQWDAADCGPPLPGEGLVKTYEKGRGYKPIENEAFYPWSKLDHCGAQPLLGVQRKAAPGTPLVFEHALDLSSSELDGVGPGDCFRLGVRFSAGGCEWGSGCLSQGNWLGGAARWPEGYDYTPPTFGKICLDPCAEDFVPEPSTLILLGSGLAGLAGYASLRWRSRQ